MSNQAIIDHLNEILKHEWTGVAQYSQASFIVEGVWREVYSGKFITDAKESFGHAQLVGEKIVSLGGVPVATRNEIKQSRVLQEILEFSLEFETKAVEMYSQAIDMAEGEKPLVIFLEDLLTQEQDGVDEYTKLLRDSGARLPAPAWRQMPARTCFPAVGLAPKPFGPIRQPRILPNPAKTEL